MYCAGMYASVYGKGDYSNDFYSLSIRLLERRGTIS